MRIAATALLIASAMAAGCAGTAPEIRYYVLATTAPGAPAPGQIVHRHTIVVGEITLPELVDRPQIVVSTREQRVRLLDEHRWAEPLRRAIPAALAAALARELPGARLVLAGEPAVREARYRVSVDVRRFESMPGEAALIETLWSVRSAAGAELRSGHSLLREPSTSGYDALVQAHARAIDRLGAEIGQALRSLDAGAAR